MIDENQKKLFQCMIKKQAVFQAPITERYEDFPTREDREKCEYRVDDFNEVPSCSHPDAKRFNEGYCTYYCPMRKKSVKAD